MAKIIAIHSGGDWYDASADYIVLPDGITSQEIIKQYGEWYRLFVAKRERREQINYISLAEFFLQNGGRRPEDSELEVVED